MTNILVTGGAGYVGSHIVKKLIENNHNVIVYDNLSQGHLSAVDKNAIFVKADLKDKDILNKTLNKHKIDAVMHMAAYVSVAESVKYPEKYFINNINNGKNLLECMKQNSVKIIVFSSSSVVYGAKTKMPLTENSEAKPENPYGQTKLAFENILKQSEKQHGINSISLRYFNAAGADSNGLIGEDHKPENHLIPNVLKVVLGQKKHIDIYGDDYNTKDGTAVRDYIHVTDLADAHILAIKSLFDNPKTDFYNLGTKIGYSVLDIIKEAEVITDKKIHVKIKKRRFGDVPVSIADPEKIRRELKWRPGYSDIKTIIKTAWNWHKTHPKGFRK